jgi:hypothetical protein
MLAEFGVQPWRVRDYTDSQLRAMRDWLDARNGGDG